MGGAAGTAAPAAPGLHGRTPVCEPSGSDGVAVAFSAPVPAAQQCHSICRRQWVATSVPSPCAHVPLQAADPHNDAVEHALVELLLAQYCVFGGHIHSLGVVR